MNDIMIALQIMKDQKTFSVQGIDVTVYSLVTTKEIFDTITVEIGGTELF